MGIKDALLAPFAKQVPTVVSLNSNGSRVVCKPAIDMIVSFERMYRIGSDGRVYPYHDALGYPTIGIGHLLSKVKFEPLEKYGSLTLEEAHALHEHDLEKFSVGVSKLLTCTVNDLQFGALVSLAFNIGLGNIQSSTLIRKLNRGDSMEDVASEFLKWDKAGGKVLRGLTRRRQAEAKMFLS